MRKHGGRDDKRPQITPWRGTALAAVKSINPANTPVNKNSEATCDFSSLRFPSTRYQGSKRKIIPWIWDHLKSIEFSSALDVFGGTGSVSYLLKKMGKAVTYNDYLKFNHQIGLALIENDDVCLNRTDIDFALTRPANMALYFVRDTFKGIYFTGRENKWIDETLTRIRSINSDKPYKQALLHYALFQSCLVKRPFNLFHRRNLYVRLANIDREFGNKTTWDKPFAQHFLAFCGEVNASVFKGAAPCKSICYNALDIPDGRYDLVYIDPPYLRNDRSNAGADYLAYYHFLEGLCQYDCWNSLIDYTTPNLRMKRTANLWTDSKERINAFDFLFEKFANSMLVISYKKFGIPSIDTLIKMLKRHGRIVRSHSKHYKYALNHQNGSAELNREVLLIAE